MRSIKIAILAMAVCMLCACGSGEGQTRGGAGAERATADDCLRSFLAQDSFTIEEDGTSKEYVDYEAAQKLFELYTAEGNSDMLQRFTRIDDQLLKMEKTVPAGVETTYCHCDENGVLQKTYSDADLSVFFACHYNEAGQLIEKSLYKSGESEPEAVCTYKYDKNGSCTRYQDEDGRAYSFKYTYDDSGKVLTGPRVEFAPEGSLIMDTIRYTYEYDDGGRVVRMTGQQTNGKDISYEFTYDDQGRVLRVVNEMPEGTVTEDYSYENGRLTERTVSLKGEVTVQKYTYGTRYIFDSEGLNL